MLPLLATSRLSTPTSNKTIVSELANSISDETAKKGMQEFRQIFIPATAIARSILFAIGQPNDVDISEIIVRPTASPY